MGTSLYRPTLLLGAALLLAPVTAAAGPTPPVAGCACHHGPAHAEDGAPVLLAALLGGAWVLLRRIRRPR